MYRVIEDFETICKLAKQEKNKLGTITILGATNIEITEDTHLQNFEIESEIYKNDTFIGTAIQRKIKANIINVEEMYDFENKEITAKTGININGTNEYVPFGNFIVETPKNEETKTITSIIGYDYMIKFNVAYKEVNTYPCTVREWIKKLASYCGVILSETRFTNENFVLSGTPYNEKDTCIKAVQDIARGIVGGYAIIGRNNELYFKNISNDNIYNISSKSVTEIHQMKVSDLNATTVSKLSQKVTINIDGNNYYSINKNKKYGPINRLTYVSNNKDITNIVINDTTSQSVNGIKELIINCSEFVQSQADMQVLAEGIWKKVKGLQYIPVEVKSYGFPYIDSGDKMIVADTKDIEQNTFIFNHTFKFSGSFASTIKTLAPTEVKQTYANSTTFKNLITENNLSTLQKAQENATNILNRRTQGYIYISDDGNDLYIADNKNISEAIKVWRYNLNGFGYSQNGLEGPFETAITMDGQIVADFITAGTMLADRIKGGTLTVGGDNNVDGVIEVKNASGNTVLLLNQLGLTLSNGSKIMGEDGLLTIFKIDTGDWKEIGWEETMGGAYAKTSMNLSIYIPENFIITTAFIKLYHAPYYLQNVIDHNTGITKDTKGYVRNLKLYKKNIQKFYGFGRYATEGLIFNKIPKTEINSAFGTNGYTAPVPPDEPAGKDTVSIVTSIDIKPYIKVGDYSYFIIESSDTSITDIIEGKEKSGWCMASLNIIGYIKE